MLFERILTGNIKVETFGDYFVDERQNMELMKQRKNKTNVMTTCSKNGQKHSLYLHVSRGKNAIEKSLWYYLAFRFHKGKVKTKNINEIEGELKTRSAFKKLPEMVPSAIYSLQSR